MTTATNNVEKLAAKAPERCTNIAVLRYSKDGQTVIQAVQVAFPIKMPVIAAKAKIIERFKREHHLPSVDWLTWADEFYHHGAMPLMVL